MCSWTKCGDVSQQSHAYENDLIKLATVRAHLTYAEYRAILREIKSNSGAVLQGYKSSKAIYVSGTKLAEYLTTVRKPGTSAEWFLVYSWSQELAKKLFHCVSIRKEQWDTFFAGTRCSCPTHFESPQDLRKIKPRFFFFENIYPEIQKHFSVVQQRKFCECLKIVREKVDKFLKGYKKGKDRVPGILETYRPYYEVDYERLYNYFLDNCVLGIDTQTVFEKMKKGRKDEELRVYSGTKEFQISDKVDIEYDMLRMDESNISYFDCDNTLSPVDRELWSIELTKLFEGEDSVDLQIFRLKAQDPSMGWEEICHEIDHPRLNTGPSVAYRFNKIRQRLFMKYKDLDFSFTKYEPYAKKITTSE